MKTRIHTSYTHSHTHITIYKVEQLFWLWQFIINNEKNERRDQITPERNKVSKLINYSLH
jgi:hypothetical protein